MSVLSQKTSVELISPSECGHVYIHVCIRLEYVQPTKNSTSCTESGPW